MSDFSPAPGTSVIPGRERPDAGPFFSIITVCRNSAATIGQTAASLLEQDFPDWEWVVVDGASTDETVSLVEKAAAGNPRLKLRSEPDTGIYNAMNKGLGRAAGQYVHFLNADDRYSDASVLREVAEQLRSRPETDFLYGNLQVKDVIHRPSPPEKVLDEMVFGCLPHQGSFARRELFAAGRVGPFNESLRIAADYEWMMSVLSDPRSRVAYFDRVIAEFSTEGVSSDLEKSLPETFSVLNRHTAFQKAIGTPRILRAYQSHMLELRVELQKIRRLLDEETGKKHLAKSKLAEAQRKLQELKSAAKEKPEGADSAASRQGSRWLPRWLRR